ncbi:hypothetical protein [Streptomyces decoyicus]
MHGPAKAYERTENDVDGACGNRIKYGKNVCARERGHIGPHRDTAKSEAHSFRWFDSEGTPAHDGTVYYGGHTLLTSCIPVQLPQQDGPVTVDGFRCVTCRQAARLPAFFDLTRTPWTAEGLTCSVGSVPAAATSAVTRS